MRVNPSREEKLFGLTCTPCFYRVIETRVDLWENEKCCGNTSDEKKKKKIVNYDYRNVNSLCSRHHYVNSALVLCLHQVIQTRFLTNQRACFQDCFLNTYKHNLYLNTAFQSRRTVKYRNQLHKINFVVQRRFLLQKFIFI